MMREPRGRMAWPEAAVVGRDDVHRTSCATCALLYESSGDARPAACRPTWARTPAITSTPDERFRIAMARQ